MSRHVSQKLAGEVELRADGVCEYCRIAINDTYFGGEIDHIRSLKHGGKTELPNLAFACQPCNRSKGTDLGSIPIGDLDLVRFFNPRLDIWSEHFKVASEGLIIALTQIGEVTATIFRFNDLERVSERKGLIELGSYEVADK